MKKVSPTVTLIALLVLIISALCALFPQAAYGLWRVVECNMPGAVCVQVLP